MAVVLKNALFLHIPKTGGEWVRQIFWDAGLEDVQLDSGKQKHADLAWFKEHPEYDRPFRFTFVRHPVAWYRSFWGYQSGRGWIQIPEVELVPPGPLEYEEFVQWVIDEHAGFLGGLYQQFTGAFGKSEVEFIGKAENLRDDLHTALWQAGCKSIPLHAIQTSEVRNKTVGWDVEPMEVDRHLMESESEVCRRFGYV